KPVAYTTTGSVAARDSASGNVDAVPTKIQTKSDSTYGPPNHLGRIPVVEYHVIGDTQSLYQRKRETFRADMEMRYARGYRPITIAQLLDKDFSAVPAGMSPVVFVFDDASASQFKYIDKGGGNLEIDPTSAIGIWNDFAKSHADWKRKAVFC